MNARQTPIGASDFDFFIGSWQVQHSRLKERLSACTEWVEFTGTCDTQKVLGGLGNFDDNLLELPEGAYRALTLRSVDPATGQWSIWWLDGRNPGQLDPPVVGQFRNGIGLFYAEDELKGRPIKVRFTWTAVDRDGPLWEQAFSADGGASWETNWRMSFKRLNA